MNFKSSYDSIHDTNSWKAAEMREKPSGIFPADMAKATAELQVDRMIDAFIEMTRFKMLELSVSKERAHYYELREFLDLLIDQDLDNPLINRNRWALKERCRKVADRHLMRALNEVAQETIRFAQEMRSQHLENSFNDNTLS